MNSMPALKDEAAAVNGDRHRVGQGFVVVRGFTATRYRTDRST